MKILNSVFLSKIWDKAKVDYMPSHRLIGVYANGQLTDQESPIHRDYKVGEKGSTLLLFGNDFWPTPWGGALNFYDEEINDVIRSVLPKPGRAVIFPGEIPYNANAPSPISRLMRMTVAFKTIRLKGLSNVKD